MRLVFIFDILVVLHVVENLLSDFAIERGIGGMRKDFVAKPGLPFSTHDFLIVRVRFRNEGLENLYRKRHFVFRLRVGYEEAFEERVRLHPSRPGRASSDMAVSISRIV